LPAEATSARSARIAGTAVSKLERVRLPSIKLPRRPRKGFVTEPWGTGSGTGIGRGWGAGAGRASTSGTTRARREEKGMTDRYCTDTSNHTRTILTEARTIPNVSRGIEVIYIFVSLY
jgi:hypothetical protein